MPRFLLRGVLDADEHGFLNSPGLPVYFFVDNAELVGIYGVSCGSAVKMHGGGGLEMFLNPFTQGPARFPYIGTGAVDVGALILVNDACLVGFGVLVLGIAQSCPEGVGPLEVDLDTSSLQFLEFVCCFGNVGDYYGGLVVAVVGGVAVGGGGGCCLVGMVELVLPLVKGPGRELAVVGGLF